VGKYLFPEGCHLNKLLKSFEKVIVGTLLRLVMIAVLVSTIELAVILFQELMKPPTFLLNNEEMPEVFGFFLMVLIGLELLESKKPVGQGANNPQGRHGMPGHHTARHRRETGRQRGCGTYDGKRPLSH
jgi:hypothetical protein